jgi:hypothetical protein
VQVQHVQLVQREDVDVLLDLSHREEVAGDVEHRAAPGEARLVDDPECGDRPVDTVKTHIRFDVGRQQLPYGLNAAEQAGRPVGDEADGVARHIELVTFLSKSSAVRREAQNDCANRRHSDRRHCDREAGGAANQ